jgi:hypothetical protein
MSVHLLITVFSAYFVKESAANSTIGQESLNYNLVKSACEAIILKLGVLFTNFDSVRSKVNLFNSNFRFVSRCENLCPIFVLAVDRAILILNAANVIFTDGHAGASDGISLLGGRDARQVPEHTVFEGTNFTLLVDNAPLKVKFGEVSTSTAGEEKLSVEIFHLTDDYTLFGNHAVRFTVVAVVLADVVLGNLSSGKELHNQSIFESKGSPRLFLFQVLVGEKLIKET